AYNSNIAFWSTPTNLKLHRAPCTSFKHVQKHSVRQRVYQHSALTLKTERTMKKYLISISAVALITALFVGAIAQPEVNKIKHPMNPNSPKFDGFALTTGGTGSVSALIDHGGQLIGTPTIYLIWYGNWNQNNGSKGDTPQGQALIRQWAQDIGG